MLGTIDRSWLWSGLAGGAMLLLLWNISAPPPEILFSDFFEAYYSSAERLLQANGPVPTWPLHKTCTEGLANIPIFAWLFVPLAWLDRPAAAWTFFVLGLAAVSAAWVLLRRLCCRDDKCGALLLLLFLANGPLMHSIREGNATHIVLLLVIVALLLWRSGSDFAAGLVLGVCATFKPPLLLFGVYFALRRRWRIVAGGATVIGLVATLSVAVFGIALNVLWYQHCIGPFLGRIMPGFNVQSLDAFLFRLVHGERYLHVWDLIEPSPAHRTVKAIIVLGLFAGAVWMLIRAERREPTPAVTGALSARDLLDYVLTLSLAIVISPLAWAHYHLLLLLPWGLYLGGLLPLREDATTRRLMAGGIVLASLPVLVVPQSMGALGPLASRTIVSGIFVGSVLTLAALARGAWQLTRQPAGDIHNTALAAAQRSKNGRIDWRKSLLIRLKTAACSSTPGVAATRKLAMIFVLSSLALNACLWLAAPSGFKSTALEQAGYFLIGRSDDDSWGPMAYALDYFEQWYSPPASTTPIYTQVDFNDGVKFQYPPSALFVTAGLRAADSLVGAAFFTDALSWLFVVLSALATAALLENRLRGRDPAFRDDRTAGLRTAVVIGLSLTFYPVVRSFTLGQIQAWINGMFALALLCWVADRRSLAGFVIGLVTLIKPHYGLIFVWGILRREWSFLAVGSGTIAFGLVWSLYVFEWANHVDYLRFLSYISQRGEAYFPNHSVNGLLNRLMSLADPVHYNNLTWRDSQFPPFNWWVYVGTLGSSVLILAVGLARRRRADDPDGVLDLCAIAVACTVAAPIAWEHHYGILLPVYAVLFAHFVHDRRRLAWLAVSYVLASNYFAVAQMAANTPFNPVQSYLLFAALMVLALLVWRPSSAREAMLDMTARASKATAS